LALVALSYVVVGGGAQGAVLAADLAARRDTAGVVVADAAAQAPSGVGGKVAAVRVDAVKQGARLARLVGEADACVVALPGSVADRALPRLALAGTPIVDISFTPEVEDRGLDAAARRARIPLVRDVGVAPGLSHMLAAGAARELDGLVDLSIHVGGLPQAVPRAVGGLDWRHAVYFNALDLMSEYLRPARMRRGGLDLAPEPLEPAEEERLTDGDLGRLDAFPSDGLRSLLSSYPKCREMREMTLRWPGHLPAMRALRAAGKLAGGPSGRSAAAKTAAALARDFPGASHPDVLLMEVVGRGPGGSAAFRVVDRGTAAATAMSRTTAFTAAAAAHLLATCRFDLPGAHPPEVLGKRRALLAAVLSDLKARGIVVARTSKLQGERRARGRARA
jgi:saccharopine dehydrogenase-like NADP-dependent oxidoreductase